MELSNALKAFMALSQETRLNVFKVLIDAGKEGLPAGELSSRLEIPKNTLSFHLSNLTHANLVAGTRHGRNIIYAANKSLVDELIGFLSEHCCSAEKR